MPRVFVEDRDLGWDSFFKRVFQLGAWVLEVGIFDNEELATAAATNEFGTESAGRSGNVRIESRPAWRTTIDESTARYERVLAAAYTLVSEGKIDIEKALDQIGFAVVSDLKRGIKAWSKPPNMPSTIRSKRRNDPLNDTGATLRAITHRVRRV